ncbi:MAG: hypothetical protein IJ640_00465 [Prevotella sp.]|nr:hypothetical protein [Prevotella sp.]
MKEVTLQIPDGKKIEWKEVNGMTVPVLVDEEVRDTRPVTERIKTFEDALKELGEDNRLVKEWRKFEGCDILSNDVIALMKLRIITLALNEGWEPCFDGTDEYRWYAWFNIVTAEKLADMSEDERKEQNILPLVGAGAVVGSRAGLGFVCSGGAWSSASASFGARLAYRTEELAQYSGEQFKELWCQWCFWPALGEAK